MLAANLLFSGLLIGFTYALVGVAVTLLVGVLGIIDLSQGAWLLFAMYASYWLSGAIGVRGSAWYYIAAAIIVAAAWPVGMAAYQLIIFPVRVVGQERWQRETREMVVTLAVSFIIAAVIILFWTANPLSIGFNAVLSIGPFTFGTAYFVAAGVAMVAAIVLAVVINRTRLGIQIRAVTMDEGAAELFGVNCERIRRMAYGIALMISALAGALIAPMVPLSSDGALRYLLVGASVMAVGGLGSISGAVYAGIFMGMVSNIVLLWYSADIQTVALFVAILLALSLRGVGSANWYQRLLRRLRASPPVDEAPHGTDPRRLATALPHASEDTDAP